MRIMTQPSLEGMGSRVALKDLATNLGLGFMAGSAGKDNTVAAKIRNRKMEDGNSKVGRQGAAWRNIFGG
jgi:hypothetical protein